MSVNYSIVFKDGHKASCSSVCFGKMNVSRWTEQTPHTASTTGLIDRPADTHAFIAYDACKNIHPMWGWDISEHVSKRELVIPGDTNGSIKIAGKKFLHLMKDLLEDLPMLKNILTVHPLLGVARVHIKEHASDEVMMALYLMRNLNQYSNFGTAYRYLLSQGYRPRFAAIMAHLMPLEYTPGLFGRQGQMNVTNCEVGEYNWVNPNTLGRNAFLRLMRQDENEVYDFVLPKWKIARGYRRDSHFSNNNIAFDPRYSNSSSNRYRKMVDCLSIPGDEPICDAHSWGDYYGFSFNMDNLERRGNHFGADQYLPILDQIVALCRENQISPFTV